jgi:hypothetical protein
MSTSDRNAFSEDIGDIRRHSPLWDAAECPTKVTGTAFANTGR